MASTCGLLFFAIAPCILVSANVDSIALLQTQTALQTNITERKDQNAEIDLANLQIQFQKVTRSNPMDKSVAQSILREFAPSVNNGHFERLWQDADKNGDNRVSAEEVAASLEKRRSLVSQQRGSLDASCQEKLTPCQTDADCCDPLTCFSDGTLQMCGGLGLGH